MKTLGKLLFGLAITAQPLCLAAQSWQYTGSLSEEKRTGTLTTLPNQTAIYVGGTNSRGTSLNRCEIYDPSTASWSLAAPMSTPRERHTTTLLPDGRLVVIAGNMGGADREVVTASVEIYDYTMKSWGSGGVLHVARMNHTSTLLNNGTILVTGGYTGGGSTASCEIYEPATGTSTSVAPMLIPRMDHTATLLGDGRVLIVGGRNGDYFTECEIYDPSSNTWNVTGAMHQARIKGSLITFSDGTVLAAAGRNTVNSSATGSELLTSPYTAWTSTMPIYQPVHWNSNTLLPDDRFLVTGGLIDNGDWGNDFSAITTPTCEWYDKKNSRWYYAPSLNLGRCYHDACYIHQNVNYELPTDLILVASGLTATNTFTATAEILDVTNKALGEYEAMGRNTASVSASNSNIATSVTMRAADEPIVNISAAAPCEVIVEVVSATGVAIQRQSLSIPMGSVEIPLDMSRVPAGIYFARINAGGIISVLKIAVLR